MDFNIQNDSCSHSSKLFCHCGMDISSESSRDKNELKSNAII